MLIQRKHNTPIQTTPNNIPNLPIPKPNTTTQNRTSIINSLSTLNRHITIHTTQFIYVTYTYTQKLFKEGRLLLGRDQELFLGQGQCGFELLVLLRLFLVVFLEEFLEVFVGGVGFQEAGDLLVLVFIIKISILIKIRFS